MLDLVETRGIPLVDNYTISEYGAFFLIEEDVASLVFRSIPLVVVHPVESLPFLPVRGMSILLHEHLCQGR